MNAVIPLPDVPAYDVDLFTDEALTNPYPLYRAMRDLGAVVWLPKHGIYAITRYADVKSALADHEAFSSASGIGLNDVANGVLQGTMLASDPPLHDHLRQVVANRLTPRSLRGRKEEIEAMAERLVAKLLVRQRFDAVEDLAYAMPMSVIPDFLGWPERGRDMLRTWAWGGLQSLGPMDKQRTQDGFPLGQQMGAYAFTLAAERDLLDGSLGADLLAALERGEITPEQCPSLLLDYLGPSIDTTAGAIGNGVAAFTHHPEQWDLVRRNPELIPAAFNEIIRFESPLRAFSRVTTRDTSVDGHVIPASSRVLIVYASGNRDERKWDRPDDFDVTRDAADHLGFGNGIHGCAGQGLARIEGHAVFAALARRVERFEFTDEPVRAVNNTLNTWKTLNVSVIAA